MNTRHTTRCAGSLLRKQPTRGLRALGAFALLLALPAATFGQSARLISSASRSARWDVSYSPYSQAQGSAHLDARAQSQVFSSSFGNLSVIQAGGTASGFIRLLGHSAEAARVEANGRLQSHQFTLMPPLRDGSYPVYGFARGVPYNASGLLRLGGRDILRPQSSGVLTAPMTVPLGTGSALDILRFTHRFFVGPIPCSLGVRAGAGASMYAPFSVNPAYLSVSVPGTLSAYAHAAISFAVDAIVASAGVTADCRFANTRATASLAASPSGLFGNLGVRLEAIRLLVSAWVRVGWGWLSKTWSTTLFNYGLGAFSTTRTLL
jgi:hypothetical protein